MIMDDFISVFIKNSFVLIFETWYAYEFAV